MAVRATSLVLPLLCVSAVLLVAYDVPSASFRAAWDFYIFDAAPPDQCSSVGLPTTRSSDSDAGKAVIPGSKFSGSPRDALKFRRRWRCLTSLQSMHWAYDPAPRPLPWGRQGFPFCRTRNGYLGWNSNKAVEAGNYSAANWPVAESLKYVWQQKQPGSCAVDAPSFRALNAAGFCAALRRTGGSLFIIGDSLSAHSMLSLENQLQMAGFPVTPLAQPPGCDLVESSLRQNASRGKRPGCDRHMICGKSKAEGGVELFFSWDRFLHNVHNITETMLGYPWGDAMVTHNASVALINRGAHFRGDPLYIADLNYTLREVRSLLPNLLLFFRSTPPGHPGCSQYAKPIEEPLTPNSSWPYFWENFHRQNVEAQCLVESVGGLFVDVEPMTSLRPDWHNLGPKNDCLHYCLPGPPDSWIQAFANMLIELV